MSDHVMTSEEIDRFLSQEGWEERYQVKEDAIWSGNPNAVLVTEVADLPPGRALDVGCGEGADAVWLAQRGWQVTGTDISTVALARAATHSSDVDWQHVDLLKAPPAPRSYDLVTAHFMQLPPAERIALYGHLAEAVEPGGTLLLVGHHPDGMPGGHARGHMAVLTFTAEDLAAELSDEWDVQKVEARSRQVVGPEGSEITLIDAVLRAVRRP
jgi:SAM-dependent methyltransferase